MNSEVKLINAIDLMDQLWCPRCRVPIVLCGACGTLGPWVRADEIDPEDRARFRAIVQQERTP